MRSRRSGVIANLGSTGGWGGGALMGMYSATKFGLGGITESPRIEVAPFDIDVTIIEPGSFRTDFLGGAHRVIAKNRIEDLAKPLKNNWALYDSANGKQPGDPVKGAQIIVEALTLSGRCEGKKLPPRLALGNDAVKVITQVLDRNLEYLDNWKDIVSTTDHDD